MALRFGDRGIAMLAGNEYPAPPFPEVQDAISAAISNVNRYPQEGNPQLKEAIAGALDIDPGCVWPGAGSSENLTTAARAMGGPGTSFVYAWPSFAMYPINAIYADAESITVPLDRRLRLDLDRMRQAIRTDTTMAIICNPNNPTGSYLLRREVEEFVDQVPESVLVVVDEAYGEFVSAEEESSLIPVAVTRPNVVVARTFSKIYGLAALRVGYMVGRPETLRSLRKAQSPFVVGSLAETAAITALRNQDRVRQRFEDNRRGVRQIEEILRAFGLDFVPTQANFVWFRIGSGAPNIVAALLDLGTLIRQGNEEWARVSVGTDEENRRFANDLKTVLEQT